MSKESARFTRANRIEKKLLTSNGWAMTGNANASVADALLSALRSTILFSTTTILTGSDHRPQTSTAHSAIPGPGPIQRAWYNCWVLYPSENIPGTESAPKSEWLVLRPLFTLYTRGRPNFVFFFFSGTRKTTLLIFRHPIFRPKKISAFSFLFLFQCKNGRKNENGTVAEWIHGGRPDSSLCCRSRRSVVHATSYCR